MNVAQQVLAEHEWACANIHPDEFKGVEFMFNFPYTVCVVNSTFGKGVGVSKLHPDDVPCLTAGMAIALDRAMQNLTETPLDKLLNRIEGEDFIFELP